MKRVVVTGATSMLGLALIDLLVKQDIHVLCLLRKHSNKNYLLPSSDKIEIIECGLSEYASLQISAREPYDTFFHYAWGQTENSARYNVQAHNDNISYTLDAVQLAASLGCRRFVGAGSQAEYGRVSGTISPDCRVMPDSAYGVAKFAAGKLGGILAGQLGMDFLWPRVFSTYGINDMHSTMIMYCISELLAGRCPELTACEQQWDYLNCRDAARAFYLIGEEGKPGARYNIGSGQARPLLYYVTVLRNAINPAMPLGIGLRAYSREQIMHLCADIDSLKADTGFAPEISFENGIRETIDWYRRTYL